MNRWAPLALGALGALGCAPNGELAAATPPAPTVAAIPSPPSAASARTADAGGPAIPATATPPTAPQRPATLPFPEAYDLVFPGQPPPPTHACAATVNPAACLLATLPTATPIALPLADELFAGAGASVGRLGETWMDGGYRGKIHLVPALPSARDAAQARWLTDGLVDFVARRQRIALALRLPADRLTAAGIPRKIRFFESVGRTTPAAMALGDTLFWNLRGSLHRSAAAVAETVIHESFHLEDDARGGVSLRELAPIHAAILERCAKAVGAARDRCLAPYAPGTTKVLGGTYYPFHGGNDAREYGAELAVRFFREAEGTASPWKCATVENGAAWTIYVTAFWGARDPLPPCGITSSSGSPPSPAPPSPASSPPPPSTPPGRPSR